MDAPSLQPPHGIASQSRRFKKRGAGKRHASGGERFSFWRVSAVLGALGP